MAAIRPMDEIARKWATVTPQRTADYEAGVRAPRKDWAQSSAAATEAWKAGVQAAIAAGSFAKGVGKAGTAKWAEASLEKGVGRWGPGVALAEDDYRTGFAPYREAIARVSLPARFARRDPRNLERVRVIVDAIGKVKAGSRG